MKRVKKGNLIITLIILFALVSLKFDLQATKSRMEILEHRMENLTLQNENLRGQVEKLTDKIENFTSEWNVGVFELTAYAPLDPRAKEGICYSGNPRITASGAKTTPGVTVAAGKNIPFGTKIFIEGFGWRVVQDRGGMIGENNIDLCVCTQEEAFDIGRKKVRVIYPVR